MMKRYVQEKDDEFERLLKDEDEFSQHQNLMMGQKIDTQNSSIQQFNYNSGQKAQSNRPTHKRCHTQGTTLSTDRQRMELLYQQEQRALYLQ